MSLLQEALDACAALTRRAEYLEHDKRLRKVGTSQRIESSDDTIMEDVSNQARMIDELDRDEGVALMGEKEEEKKAEEVKDIVSDEHVKGRQAKIYQIDMDHAAKVLCMQKDTHSRGYIGSNAKYSETKWKRRVRSLWNY
nr:hypothetical protein [Tanacetum cinerariifolium]